MGFVSLHNHSDYSLLDGASQISKRSILCDYKLIINTNLK